MQCTSIVHYATNRLIHFCVLQKFTMDSCQSTCIYKDVQEAGEKFDKRNIKLKKCNVRSIRIIWCDIGDKRVLDSVIPNQLRLKLQLGYLALNRKEILELCWYNYPDYKREIHVKPRVRQNFNQLGKEYEFLFVHEVF